MTVESLETARNLVEDVPDIVAAVYRYTHAITGKTLYSVESWMTRGTTLASHMVLDARMIYDVYDMVWMEEVDAINS